MATAIGDLVVRLGADNKRFNKSMRQSQSITARFTSGVSGLVRAMIPLSAGGAFAAVARQGEMFNREMNRSLAIMGDVSSAMREDMKNAAFQAAAATRFASREMAQAYYYLASAGMDAEQSIAALPAVAAFAQAGNFDLATATDLATDAQSALGLSVKDAIKNHGNLVRVTDVLIKANTMANASAQQFSESLTNKAGAALRNLGKDMEEGVAVLAAYADQGIKGAEAGTALGIVLRDLQTKAIKEADAFLKAKVNVFDTAGEMRNLADIIADLESKFAGLADKQQKAELMMLGFTDKSVGYMQSLMGMSEKIRDYEQALRDAGGTTAEVAAKQLTDAEKAAAKFEATMTRLGESLMTNFGPSAASTLETGLSAVTEVLKRGNVHAGLWLAKRGKAMGIPGAGDAVKRQEERLAGSMGLKGPARAISDEQWQRQRHERDMAAGRAWHMARRAAGQAVRDSSVGKMSAADQQRAASAMLKMMPTIGSAVEKAGKTAWGLAASPVDTVKGMMPAGARIEAKSLLAGVREAGRGIFDTLGGAGAREPQLAGAMTKGSRDAYSAIVQAGLKQKKPLDKVERNTRSLVDKTGELIELVRAGGASVLRGIES